MATPSENPLNSTSLSHQSFSNHPISIKLTESNYGSNKSWPLLKVMVLKASSQEKNPVHQNFSWVLGLEQTRPSHSFLAFWLSLKQYWSARRRKSGKVSRQVLLVNQEKSQIMKYRSQLQGIKKGTMGMREYLNKIKGSSCVSRFRSQQSCHIWHEQPQYWLGVSEKWKSAGLNISHLGSSIMTASNNYTFLLKNLLHVPNMKKNLISSSDNKVYFEFLSCEGSVNSQDSTQSNSWSWPLQGIRTHFQENSKFMSFF